MAARKGFVGRWDGGGGTQRLCVLGLGRGGKRTGRRWIGFGRLYFWRLLGLYTLASSSRNTTNCVAAALVISPCIWGAVTNIWVFCFKNAIFHHFLFLALTLRLAPTLILPLPEFLDPPKMLGR